MRQPIYTMFITNNHNSFYVWWHEILSNIKISQNIMARIVDSTFTAWFTFFQSGNTHVEI